MFRHDERDLLGKKIMNDILTEAVKAGHDIKSDVPFVVGGAYPPPTPEESGLTPDEIARYFRFSGVSLHYWISCTSAEMDLYLSTCLLGEERLRRCSISLEKYLANTIVTDKDGHSYNLRSMVSPELRASLLEKLTRRTIEEFIYRIKERFETAGDELMKEASLFALAGLYSEFYEELMDLGVREVATDYIDMEARRITGEIVANRKAFIKEMIDYMRGPQLEYLEEKYQEVLPIWRDAKLLYTQNRNRTTWRAIILAAYPELKYVDDLVSRLSGKLNDLPEDIQAKLAQKGGNSNPSSIALEHASRLCGAERYQYSVRYLYYKRRRCKGGEI